MGAHHARVLRSMPAAELVGVCDPNQARAAEVGGLYGVDAYSDVAQLLEVAKPEAVTVAVPTNLHRGVAGACLEAGCHVLVEKPLALEVAQAQELIDLSDRHARVLAVGHVERYNPAVIELKRRIDEGQLGDIFKIHARRLGPFPEQVRDVGVVVDLATHDIDVMRYLTGSEPNRVFAETMRWVHDSHEDLLAALLHFESGALGILDINWLTPTKVREISVTGERGMFRADYLTQDLFWFENAGTSGPRWENMEVLRGVREGSMTRFALSKEEPLRAELRAFLANLAGEPARIVSGRDGTIALEVALSLLRSSADGQVVSLRS